jgi:hypothetical protein
VTSSRPPSTIRSLGAPAPRWGGPSVGMR